ncbi:hypothetical protein [Sphaerospermopsis torques-reginae]|uniref:DUF2281 domain-containing protein n=1 Tax=Sphaerospermopsis torques-reginae ITEP-024 TaxID=984208 RepID=A0ABX8X439_9CYAN|nr:hypothetical protein [Sphaerospermopsis torques-reginae]QYX33467.1 hypothetical protein K2F26_09205 [Sphaerospermopsis torques-reginae ITEP-024]
MPNLTLSDQQLIELVKQLPSEKQAELCEYLLLNKWGGLDKFTKDGEHHLRLAAWKRGKNWDGMDEEERSDFIDDIVHEDRLCCQ